MLEQLAHDELVEMAREDSIEVYSRPIDDDCQIWKSQKIAMPTAYKVVKRKKLKNGYFHRQIEKRVISFFPNPSYESITIEYPPSNATNVEIYTLNGQLMSRSLLVNGEKNISLKELTSGVYMINIICDGRSVQRDKLLVIK